MSKANVDMAGQHFSRDIRMVYAVMLLGVCATCDHINDNAISSDTCNTLETIATSSSDTMGTLIMSPNFPGKYPNNAKVCWLLTTDDINLSLTIDSYETESIADAITIYDGSDTSSNQLAVLSGVGYDQTYVSSGNIMLVRFTSDISITNDGFQACVCPAAIEPCDCQWIKSSSINYMKIAWYALVAILSVSFVVNVIRITMIRAKRMQGGRAQNRNGATTVNNSQVQHQPDVSVISNGPQAYPRMEYHHPIVTSWNQPMPADLGTGPLSYAQPMNQPGQDQPLPTCPPPPYPGQLSPTIEV